jgi:hypothetical protein
MNNEAQKGPNQNGHSVRDQLLPHSVVGFVLQHFYLPRLLLDVFTRSNFGKRYLKFRSVVFATLLMFFLPWLHYHYWFGSTIRKMGESYNETYLTWNVFAGMFFILAFYHKFLAPILRGKKHEFKNSYWWGDPHPFFEKVTFGKPAPYKWVVCFIEPFFCFFAGSFLSDSGERIGGLIEFCSVCMAISSWAHYYTANNMYLDMQDEIIDNGAKAEIYGRIMEARMRCKDRWSDTSPEDKTPQEDNRNETICGNGRVLKS